MLIFYVLVIGAIVVLAPVSTAELLSRSNAKLTPNADRIQQIPVILLDSFSSTRISSQSLAFC